ncbi:hypothetical protein [Thermus thermamylovorans]|uniref:Lipoprotein n=1 Tax=Thermus thermamylovorans TaxID=2509362 RepID=A0A4Q9B654_9DEIN|nr:hypothetical protein [Thermus thermamylovorans]TBH20880.1 hypothetical protein ETP66_05570 [Thermus thermamylovorans]
MKGLAVRFGFGLMLLGLAGCSNFFEGGIAFSGPTVLVSRENLSFKTETDQNGNTTYTYSYQIVLYSLPGSGVGIVELLDASNNQVESPFLIPQSCPPANTDPCGPYTRQVDKSSPTPLSPVQAVKYRSISPNGQEKVLSLPAPIELY